MVPILQTIVLLWTNFLRMGRSSKGIGTKATTHQKKEWRLAKTHQEGAGAVFAGRPPGNSPELMPWGTSLKKDVDDCVARHVAVGYGLKEGDLGYSKQFFQQTLGEQTSAYKRLIDPALGMEKELLLPIASA
jgi:hypothetical protein